MSASSSRFSCCSLASASPMSSGTVLRLSYRRAGAEAGALAGAGDASLEPGVSDKLLHGGGPG
eukprot:6391666-Prymnesium_polylepis.1